MLRFAPLIVLLAVGACQTRKPAPASAPGAVVPAPPTAETATHRDATVEISMRLIKSRHPHSTATALDADATIEQLTSPRITVHPFQRGSMTVMNEQAYISRFDFERTDDTLLADPVVEVLQDGVMVEIAPHPTADGRWTGLVKLTESRLNGMTEAEMPIVGSPVTVQLPDVTTWNTARVLEPRAEGRWVLNLGERGPGEWRLLDIAMAPGPLVHSNEGRPGK